jgi:heme-degrading monooxygenase HmoA
MPVVEIVQFHTGDHSIDSVVSVIPKIIQALDAPRQQVSFYHVSIGTHVQDPNTLQITAEKRETTEAHSIIETLRPVISASLSAFNVTLESTILGPNGPAPATAPIVEYVQTWFPVSRVTPEFQREIESDFRRFDDIFTEGAKNTTGCTSGWILEEQEHDKIVNEKAKCFLVVRGWESMDDFQAAVEHDAFKTASPIVFGWNAPFKMVSFLFIVT